MDDSPVIKSFDPYEVAFYLWCGCEVTAIEAIPENKNIICKFSVEGPSLLKQQEKYFRSQAMVNLHSFRRCYTRVQNLIANAKKSARIQMKASKTADLPAGGEA